MVNLLTDCVPGARLRSVGDCGRHLAQESLGGARLGRVECVESLQVIVQSYLAMRDAKTAFGQSR
jgi:hypothetical protein